MWRRPSPKRFNKAISMHGSNVSLIEPKHIKSASMSIDQRLPKIKTTKKSNRVHIEIKSTKNAKKTNGSFGSWDAEDFAAEELKFSPIKSNI